MNTNTLWAGCAIGLAVLYLLWAAWGWIKLEMDFRAMQREWARQAGVKRAERVSWRVKFRRKVSEWLVKIGL